MSSKETKENVLQLLDGLRDAYIAYKETLGRCKIEMKPKNINRNNPGELLQKQDREFSNFYVPPKVIQLDEPEKQKRFRKEYISEVGGRPEPEPTNLIADELHYEALNQISNHSDPAVTREDLAAFFRRRVIQLQHKKYKMLGRWANQATQSQVIEDNSVMFERMLSRLQQEFDSAVQRSERLKENDAYKQAVDPDFPRPQPVSKEEEIAALSEGGSKPTEKTLLYVEQPDKIINSCIRHDDIEVYLRISTYRASIFRMAEKLACSIKWLPYSRRFDIWTQSRVDIYAFKSKYQESRHKFLNPVLETVNSRLLQMVGVGDNDKLLHMVREKFVKHLKQEEYPSRNQAALNCHIMNHEKPPLLITSNVELNIYLIPLANDFLLSTGEYLEMDDGHNFSYQVQGLFAPTFQAQVLKMQFDPLDSGELSKEETDVLLIQKLTSELGLDKNEMLKEMARQTEIERGKSILGRLGKNGFQSETTAAKNKGSQDEIDADHARNNLIRRIKEMKFFSLDETDYKLVKADWLPYICWQQSVNDNIKRQNNILSNKVDNPIDSLLLSSFEFTDVNEAGATNKILEDASTAHIRKVKSYFTELSSNTTKLNLQNKDQKVKQILTSAVQRDSSSLSKHSQDKSDDNPQFNNNKVEGYLQNVDPLKHNLIKSYYTLRLLKTRNIKCQMVQALNYFRSVQKRLAFDIREFYSRERALGGQKINDGLIGPQFGKDSEGNLKAKSCGTQGPGQINANRLLREQDTNFHILRDEEDKKVRADPISLKGYKYNKKFNPDLTSTCPCMPKYHTTFGRPTLYEEVSQQIEREEMQPNWKPIANPIVSYKDRLIFTRSKENEYDCDIQVLDQHGIKVVYQEALNDMLQLEEEMLKIGSYFINKAEILQHTDNNDQPATLIDRGEVTQQIFKKELLLQVHKIELLEVLLEVYENTYDPLESVRLVQVISDVMAIRPRINLDATYFNDSYDSELEALQLKVQLYREVLEVQKEIETQENEKVRKFQELKFRKLQDYCGGKWEYHHTDLKHKVVKIGSKEEKAVDMGLEVSSKTSHHKMLEELMKRKTLEEISKRHITEFAGEQATDFANVLGLPQVTTVDLFKKQGQLDPVIIDTMREFCTFSKQTEGYPWFFQKANVESSSVGLQTNDLGMYDFFDSVSSITRINAACDQAFQELIEVFHPENGMAASAMEVAMLREACGQMRIIRTQFTEKSFTESKAQGLLEEDFYFGSSDKMIYMMRELKSELNPNKIADQANPMHVAKLSPIEVAKFDFPRLKPQDIDNFQKLSDEQVAEKMINLAKHTVARKFGQDDVKGSTMDDDDFDFGSGKEIKSPSMLVISCNTVEAVRLRTDLINIQHEVNVLSEIYQDQLEKTNKTTWKLRSYDPIPFEVQGIAKDNMNYVDKNDGSKLEYEIEIQEFDKHILANMDFRSESCIKALMLNLGVEELRAIVHYQLMQKQLLSIGVLRNQALLDGSFQGFEELDMIKRKPSMTVPGSMIKVRKLLSKAVDGIHVDNAKNEQTRLSSSIAKDAGEHMYSISVRKNRYRQAAQKKYNVLLQRVNHKTVNPEAKLRILRSFRVSLTHEFCSNVLNEAYRDSLSIQILLSLRQLRRKTGLFPKGTQLFKVRLGNMQEHLPTEFTEREEVFFKGLSKKDTSRNPSLDDLLEGRTENLFYIPSSSEVMEAIRAEQQDNGTILSPLTKYVTPESLDLDQIDQLIYKLIEPPNRVPVSDQYSSKQDRIITFKEAYNYNGLSLDLLQFYNNLLQVTTLEYLMGRNDANGNQVLTLEEKANAGIEFWKSSYCAGMYESDEENSERLKSAPEAVVQKIMNSKKLQMDLTEDILQISERLEQINTDFVKKAQNQDHLKLPFLKNLLKLQHQSSFFQFLSSLEQCLDIYIDHKAYQNFSKIQSEIFSLTRKDYGFNMLGNGVYFNLSTRRSIDINPSSPMLRDNEQFERSYQPMVDEQALIPPQQTLVQKLYGQISYIQVTSTPHTAWSNVPDYKSMSSAFYNIDDEQRSFISSNFQQLDESMTNYLVFKGLITDPLAKKRQLQEAKIDGNKTKKDEKPIIIHRPIDIMQARCEYLGHRVEAKHLQRVLMSWFTGKAVPNQIKDFQKSLKLFRDNTMLKILMERDNQVEHYYTQKDSKSDQSLKPNTASKKSKRATILESVNVFSREHGIVMQLFQTKSEIMVCKQVLDLEMIKISLDVLSTEQASLMATFEQGAADRQVHILVHPTQQFASTFYQSVDKDSHLNVINKVEFVQAFLTKLRNRCTEVETLASGPGIVFSIKDFNECLQNFCQGALKYCELELRSRVETAHIRENQYQHLLYMKEKSALYYRRKCEQFLEDIDKLVNSKISQKGGQLLYELDVSTRELRVLRDNYRLMEKMMTQELRHEYIREIQERDDMILRLKDAYKDEKSRVSKTTVVEIESDFKVLLEKVEKKGQQAVNTELTIHTKDSKPGYISKNLSISSRHPSIYMTQPTSFEAETLRECLSLSNYITKYKAFVMMKNVLQIERHEKELANQRAQLTSNAALWDQLAEAEKREQISKQELNLTKLTLASYEKLIEKLQGQLENLNNQKTRLQQYKNTKSKRIEELENKMKDVEILENIDLNKILTELKNRDKKINYLSLENKAQKNEITFIAQEHNNKEILRLQKELNHERDLKNQAYDRLEGMRVELRALEAQDNKSDLWKEKCKEMFEICRELEHENENLKLVVEEKTLQQIEAQNSDPNMVYNQTFSKSMGNVGQRHSLNSKGGQRFLSNRTVGMNVQGKMNVDYQQNSYTITPGMAAGHEMSNKQTSLPSVFNSGNFDGKQEQHERDLMSSNNPTTINTNNIHSRGNSGHPKQQHFNENPDIISVESKVPMTQATIGQSGVGQNAGSSISGGVLGGPFQHIHQQRNIMTAGGYGRQRVKKGANNNDDFGLKQHVQIPNAKRLQTSNGPRVGMTATLSKKGSHSIGAPRARKNMPGQQAGVYQHSQNNLVGLNMMGKKIGIEVSKQSQKPESTNPKQNQQSEPYMAPNTNSMNINFEQANINIQNGKLQM